jgi:hypothetical protein
MGFRSGSMAMTAYYGIEGHPWITVGSAGFTALIDAACQWIEDECP